MPLLANKASELLQQKVTRRFRLQELDDSRGLLSI